MNVHIAIGVFGIVLIAVGSFLVCAPDVARAGILKQLRSFSREGAARVYTRALMCAIGIGQIVLGVAFVTQWVVSTR